MTVLQITVPEKKEKAVMLILKELGVTVKKVEQEDKFTEKFKTIAKEVRDIKNGKAKAKDFDDFLNEL